MKLTFTSTTTTKGLKLVFDTDTKEYKYCCGINPTTILYVDTNKDLERLEKELIKNGYVEIE